MNNMNGLNHAPRRQFYGISNFYDVSNCDCDILIQYTVLQF